MITFLHMHSQGGKKVHVFFVKLEAMTLAYAIEEQFFLYVNYSK